MGQAPRKRKKGWAGSELCSIEKSELDQQEWSSIDLGGRKDIPRTGENTTTKCRCSSGQKAQAMEAKLVALMFRRNSQIF